MWPPAPAPLGNAVDLLIIATLDQLIACYGPDGTATANAGLARMSLAGQIGTYPGATLDPTLLARLACDSPLRRVLTDNTNGPVLNVGRSHRFATPAQRQALAVRDGGCVVPGCHAPPEWSEAHHLIPWEHGGRTDINAMTLLCRTHHTAHHAGVYDLELRNGIPWIRVPTWIDPERPWLRNTTHQHHTTADTIATTLLEPPA